MYRPEPIDPTRIGSDVAEFERCLSGVMCDLLFEDRQHEDDPNIAWWSPAPLIPTSEQVTATKGMLSDPQTDGAHRQSNVTSRSPDSRRSASWKQPSAEQRIDNIRRRMAMAVLVLGLLATAFCFIRGASAPIEQTRAIEDIRPGHRVIVDAPAEALATDVARLNDLDSSWNASTGSLEIEGVADPLRELNEATAAQLEKADYRLVLLQAKEVWEDGTYNEINVQTLQPWQWLHENEVHVGGEAPLPLETVEMNLPAGMTGKVLDILPCPKLERGAGRTVLTTVNRLARGVIELTLRDADGKEEALRPTDEHLFYSASQGDWLSTGELQPGEHLDGVNGLITVAAVTPLEGTHRVYNMTVQGEHLYRVAECGVLVHNFCLHRVFDDALGRVRSAVGHITIADLGTGTATNASTRSAARALGTAGDDAGHLISKLLGGPGGSRARNFFAQNPHINRGQFAQLEQQVADFVRNGDDVWVRIAPRYSGNATRADGVLYQVRVNGETIISHLFPN